MPTFQEIVGSAKRPRMDAPPSFQDIISGAYNPEEEQEQTALPIGAAAVSGPASGQAPATAPVQQTPKTPPELILTPQQSAPKDQNDKTQIGDLLSGLKNTGSSFRSGMDKVAEGNTEFSAYSSANRAKAAQEAFDKAAEDYKFNTEHGDIQKLKEAKARQRATRLEDGTVVLPEEADAYIEKLEEQEYLKLKKAADTLESASQRKAEAEEKNWQARESSESFKAQAKEGKENYDSRRGKWVQATGNVVAKAMDPVEFLTSFVGMEAIPQTVRRFADSSYKQPQDRWTQNERDRFYWLREQNKDEAEKYAEEVNRKYDAAQVEKEKQGITDWVKNGGDYLGEGLDKKALAWYAGVMSGKQNQSDWNRKAAETLLFGEPRSRGHITLGDALNTASQAAAEDLNEKYSFDESTPVVGGKGLGDLFSLTQSIAKSAMGAKALGSAGELPVIGNPSTLLMFGDVANQTYDEVIARGGTPKQALALSTLAGAGEMLTEKYSVEAMLADPTNAVTYLKNLLVSEGSEEVASDLLFAINDDLIMGDKSRLALRRQEIAANNPNMSQQEIDQLATKEWLIEMGWDFVGGALSGGLHGAANFAMGGNFFNNSGSQTQEQAATPTTSQEAAEAPVAQGYTETAPAPAQASQQAPAVLNSQQSAEQAQMDEHYARKAYMDEHRNGFKAAREAYQGVKGQLVNQLWNGYNLQANEWYDYAETVAKEMAGVITPVYGKDGAVLRYTGMDAQYANNALAFEQMHPEAAAEIRQTLEQQYGQQLREAAQKDAGTPVAQEGAETAEQGAETPTEAPALLNSEENATEQNIDEKARQIFETPYQDEFYGEVKRDWSRALDSEKFWTYLQANGVDTGALADSNSRESRLAFELQDLVSHGGKLSPSAAAQAFAEAVNSGELSYPKIISRAYEIAGTNIPSGVRAEYMPTAQDRADRAKLDENYSKGMVSYYETLAKKAEREGNTEYAQRMRERAAEEKAKAAEAKKRGKIARQEAQTTPQSPAETAPLAQEGQQAEQEAQPAQPAQPAEQAASGGDGESGPPRASAPTETETGLAPQEQVTAQEEQTAEQEEKSLTEKPQEGPKPIPNGAKLSRFWEHTLQTVEEAANAPEEVKQPLWYMPKSEVQSLAEAASRLDQDTQGTIEDLVKSEAWSGVQYDAATMVADQLYNDGLKTGDYSGYSAWRLVMKDHVGDTARGLQAVKKSTRHTGRSAVDGVIDQLDQSSLPEPVKQEVITEAAEYGKELDSIKEGDIDSLKDLVKRLARRRKTWTLFGKSMDKLLNKQSEAWLREAAYRQINAIGRDAQNRGFRNMGAKIASYRVLSMLSGIPTVGGNLVGNASFGNLFDLFAEQGPGRAIDALLGNLTGQRSVVGSRGPVWKTVPEWWKNATKLMQTSMLETALDIDVDSDVSRPLEMPANSAFIADSNAVERLFQRWSQIMSYALTSSDRFFRGGIESGEAANYEAFDQKMAEKGKSGTNLTEEERNNLAKAWADYRLFQNETGVSNLQKTLRRAMNNLLGIGGEKNASGKRTKDNTFGLGSVVMPFVEVPTNLALKTLEWGPGNMLAAAKDFGKLLWTVHQNSQAEKVGSDKHVSTAALQQKTAMEAARGLSGTAFIALAAILARLGLIKNGDDEDDYDVSAVNKTTGQKGTQFNISGISRAASGGSVEWQPGDVTIGMDRIQPLNMWLKAGILINDMMESEGWWEKSAGEKAADLSKSYLQASAESILEMPLFQNMQNMTNTMRNADKFEWSLLGDLAGTALDNQMSSLVPQFVRQSAKAADPYARDTASDSWMQQRVNNAMQYIPGLRNMLPEKVDSFGQPMEQPGTGWERWLNGLVSPVSFTTYDSNEVVDMLAGLREETGKANFYPNRKPPKAVDLPTADGSDKESVTLNTEQKRAYQETYGKAYTGLMESFIASDEWKNLSAADRKKILEQAESLANDLAKRQLAESLGRPYSSDWDDELQDIPSKFLWDYLESKQSFKSAINDGDFDAVDALLNDMGKHDSSVTDRLYDDITRLDDREEAYKAGVKSETWSGIYDKYKELNKTEGLSATDKSIAFARYLENVRGLNAKQKALMREQFKFYTTSAGRTDTFDKLTDAGLSTEKSAKLYETIHGLQPTDGHSGVTQNQKIEAIRTSMLTDAEKWAALKVYASDACYKSAMEAKAAGKSFYEWAMAYTSK